MKCPHCEEEIPGSPCPGCGENVFDDDANYCMACGIPLKETVSPVSRGEDFFDGEEDIDFDNRELCPDGTCTGIIVDGRCTECGKSPEEKDSHSTETETEEATAEEFAAEAETDETAKEKND